MSTVISVSFADLPWQRADAGPRRRVVDGTRMTVTRYSFRSGDRFPLHVHDQEQIVVALAGSITFSVEEKEFVVEDDRILVIPPDVPHSATAGKQGAEVLSFVSPPRTEGRGIQLLPEEPE